MDSSIVNHDKIDCLVQEIWLECPGLGISALQQKVQERLSTQVSKQRIKTAKTLIPYRFIVASTENNDNDDKRQQQQQQHYDFAVQKIQERQSLRANRRFEEADHIFNGLQAMGIHLDDEFKTWTFGTPKIIDDTEKTTTRWTTSGSNGVKCKFCGHYFASRNLVFQHLRNPASGCGTAIFASGQTLPPAPSTQKKSAVTALPSAPGRTARHAPASQCIWLGDLPLAWTRPKGRYKRLRALLFTQLPNTIQEPWIKTVVRKAYRRGDGSEIQYLGYAIIVFRDEPEATTARNLLDGKRVSAENTFQQQQHDTSEKNGQKIEKLPNFTLKVRPVSQGDTAQAETAWPDEKKGNQDPPLEEQFRPLELSELQRRIKRIEACPEAEEEQPMDKASYLEKHQHALDKLVSLMQEKQEQPPRRYVYTKGRPIPNSLLQPLLDLLENLRWPAKNDRPRLTSERYLVLPTNVQNDRFYNELRQACRALMDWADPTYYYSGIAATKNFVASPHMDVKDCNDQYAVAIGDFEGGGQLCVESENDGSGDDCEAVNVIDTKNCIARLDGRHVHWVRSWEKGDRYSLIFYDTTKDRDKENGGDKCFKNEKET